MRLRAISMSVAIIIAVIVLVAIIGGVFYYMATQQPTTVTGPQPSKGVVLRVITRHPSDILEVAKQKFLQSEMAKKYNIVDIEWLSVGPALWIETIKAAGDIDVGWGGGPTLFDMVAKEGLIAPLDSPEVMKVIKDIPDKVSGVPLKRYKNNDLIWVAAAISSFGITVNYEFLDKYNLPQPKSWKDLTLPIYATTLPTPSIGVADPLTSTSNTRMYEIILQIYDWEEGWKILTLIGANARIYPGSGDVREAVRNGIIGAGITIDFYGYTTEVERPNVCKYILPSDGTIINGDPIAVLVTSKNKEAAQAFIAWVLSSEGQKVWLDKKINRLPANPKVFETPEGHERPDLKKSYDQAVSSIPIEFSDELALSYEKAMQYFFEATIVRAHDKLQAAWEKLATAYLNGKIDKSKFNELVDMLSNPLKLEFTDPETGTKTTFTIEYAQKINDRLGVDSEFTSKIVDAWRTAAEKRYDMVLQTLGG